MRPRTDYIISKDEVYGYANHWLTVALKTSTGLTGTGLTGGFAGTHGGEASRGHSAITGAGLRGDTAQSRGLLPNCLFLLFCQGMRELAFRNERLTVNAVNDLRLWWNV